MFGIAADRPAAWANETKSWGGEAVRDPALGAGPALYAESRNGAGRARPDPVDLRPLRGRRRTRRRLSRRPRDLDRRLRAEWRRNGRSRNHRSGHAFAAWRGGQ